MAAAHGHQATQHHQRAGHHGQGKPKDLNARLKGEIAELIGGKAGEDLDLEDEEGPVGRVLDIEELWKQKARQRSSQLFEGQNLFNSLLR